MPLLPARPHPAIFLDRDGVIIENRADYVKTQQEIVFIPGALAALALAAREPGYRLVVVTNQSAIGRGVLSPLMAEAINDYVRQQVVAAGGRLDGLYVCPHAPGAGCACRKPEPGMLLQAAEALGLDLPASVMIGDSLSDIQAGRAAGTRTLLVRTGLGAYFEPRLAEAGLSSVPVLADLAAALAYWLS
ncbi:MAG: HAD-IIIA family hydrolase [Anaerolineales bacterium]|nr:HAD-IIIA family hydrolase [Anaerolineales bacterium]